jgi:hypothetical protein
MDKRYEFWRSRRQREQIDRQLSHRRQRHVAADKKPTIPHFADIVAEDNLARVAQELACAGPDKAAGPDEAKFGELSLTELWDICRSLSNALRLAQYEPSARRIARIRKRDRGWRELSIRSIVHRIVSKAVYDAIYPAIEPVFLDHSYGFLHGRGPWDMLIALRRDVRTNGKILAINDIKKAFDFVPIRPVMEDLSRHVKDNDLMNLVLRILRGHPSDIREQADVGIDQGSALSPLLLNILLHHRLDVPLAGTSVPVVRRYADNLCLVATTELQGTSRMLEVEGLLHGIGMTAKYPVTALDLTVQTAEQPELLGYQLGLDSAGELTFDPAQEAWASLAESLQEAYDSEQPTRHAQSAIAGWCAACGPALETTRIDVTVGAILSEAASYGFRSIKAETVRRDLQASLDRWRACNARCMAA